MKVFNTLCVLGSIFFCERILNLKQFKNRKVIWILGLFSIHIFLVQSSGLTEPLAALFLSAGIYLYLKNHFYYGLIILSFLPFIRSEGWVMLCVAIVMLLYQKRFRLLPFVTFGTVVYGIIGQFYYHDFLWMFHQNPYSGVELVGMANIDIIDIRPFCFLCSICQIKVHHIVLSVFGGGDVFCHVGFPFHILASGVVSFFWYEKSVTRCISMYALIGYRWLSFHHQRHKAFILQTVIDCRTDYTHNYFSIYTQQSGFCLSL